MQLLLLLLLTSDRKNSHRGCQLNLLGGDFPQNQSAVGNVVQQIKKKLSPVIITLPGQSHSLRSLFSVKNDANEHARSDKMVNRKKSLGVSHKSENCAKFRV